MSAWSRLVLVASMLVWSALTAAAGWRALRAEGTSVPAAEASVVFDVASPAGGRETYLLPRHEADAAIQGLRDDASTPPAASRVGKLTSYPVPIYAQPAGVDPRSRPAGRDGPGLVQDRPRAASRGVVVLDPGHGRGDPGATHYLNDGSGRWDITEADSNLRNAELIRDELVALGYDVYLTRDGYGRGPDGPLTQRFISRDLWWRSQFSRSVDADVYLALHGNGATVRSISGPETWYCGRHAEGPANEEFARLIQDAMMDALHEYGYFPPDRGIKEDAESHHGDFCQFVVVRETPVPAALLEFLFLSNDGDAAVLLDDRSHVLLAKHVARAIDEFLTARSP